MLTNLHCISNDNLILDKMLMIWLAFGCLFRIDELSVWLIHQIHQHFLSSYTIGDFS